MSKLDNIVTNVCMHSQRDKDGVVTIIYEGLSPKELKQQIRNLMLETIGEDEGSLSAQEEYTGPSLTVDQHYRNSFRKELRKKVNEL
jgi:transposase